MVWTGGPACRSMTWLPLVQLHKPRLLRGIFEMKRRCFENVGAKFFPGLRFREDGMTQRTRAVATLLPVANSKISSMP